MQSVQLKIRIETMSKKRILLVINQFFKGGAETALLNLFQCLSPDDCSIDFLVFDQINLPDTVSLVQKIPSWINVINVAEHEAGIAFVKKAWFKIYRKLTRRQLFRKTAIDYVRKHTYDIVISFGEWFSCSLVAEYANACRKYVWIHADMDKAQFLNPDIERLHGYFDGFIFASEASRQSAMQKYSFLRHCSCVVNNVVNDEEVRKQSQQEIKLPEAAKGRPILLTVANLRPEKNHLRQIEAMRILRDRGIDFCWLNIGSAANMELTHQLKQAISAAGLEQDFLLLGAQENPYAYMTYADAVCVLSNHESWSMVITEAKTLGVPVIATRTSGAQEQIVHGETGILCDFSAKDIADQIQVFLGNASMQAHIREQLSHFVGRVDSLKQFYSVIQNDRRRTLFVFDNINYKSGMRTAGLLRMEHQRDKEKEHVDAFSIEPCTDEEINSKWRVLDRKNQKVFRCLSVPCRQVLSSDEYRLHHKLLRCVYALSVRVKMDELLCNWLFYRYVKGMMERYDAVYVMSEASKARSSIARLKHPRKIQFIHTDYAAWKNLNSWTKNITAHDAQIYAHYDEIVCLSEKLGERFCGIYPQLSDKVTVIPNLIPADEIRRKAEEHCAYDVHTDCLNLITIGRMEWEKRYDRLLEIAGRLKEAGVCFHWYFVGDGNLMDEVREQRKQLDLENEVTLTGAMENPYPLLKRCDLFVLLSEYEGTPVTIEEAKVLGVPVLANDVGGIADQLEAGKHGRIITKNDLTTEKCVEIMRSGVLWKKSYS